MSRLLERITNKPQTVASFTDMGGNLVEITTKRKLWLFRESSKKLITRIDDAVEKSFPTYDPYDISYTYNKSRKIRAYKEIAPQIDRYMWRDYLGSSLPRKLGGLGGLILIPVIGQFLGIASGIAAIIETPITLIRSFRFGFAGANYKDGSPGRRRPIDFRAEASRGLPPPARKS